MRFFKALGTLGGIVFALYFVSLIWEGRRLSVDSPTAMPSSIRRGIKTALLAITGFAVLLVLGGLAFAYSGVYNIAADTPHIAPVEWMLKTVRTRSVQLHSRGVQSPDLHDQLLISQGFVLYRKNCQPCHGAPGVAGEQIGTGINPKPPRLTTAQVDWTDSELYWIISHGLKMSGMPAFEPPLSDRDRWAIVAFLRRLNRFSPHGYRDITEAVDAGIEPRGWGIEDTAGFAQLRNGDPDRGRELLNHYGCVTCHTIPDVGHGMVGPPLTRFADRQYIAGFVVNVPTNLVQWISDPRKYKPNTAMPTLGVSSQDAVDIAAYLYTIGSSKRLDALKQ